MEVMRGETPAEQAERERVQKWLRGADANKKETLLVEVEASTMMVYLGQKEHIEMRINRLAIPLASLAQAVASILSGVLGQMTGVQGRLEGGAGGGNGPGKAS